MSKSSKRKERIAKERFQATIIRGELCEFCGQVIWTDAHHALIKRDSRFEAHLNVPMNFCYLCRHCHETQPVETQKFRNLFYQLQIERGYDVDSWINKLPLKIKPRFWFIQQEVTLPLAKYFEDENGKSNL